MTLCFHVPSSLLPKGDQCVISFMYVYQVLFWSFISAYLHIEIDFVIDPSLLKILSSLGFQGISWFSFSSLAGPSQSLLLAPPHLPDLLTVNGPQGSIPNTCSLSTLTPLVILSSISNPFYSLRTLKFISPAWTFLLNLRFVCLAFYLASLLDV